MIYDVIIVGAGAAGLYAGICLDKNLKKIVLEKTERPGTKVLMSGGERANVSNADIEPMRDYFTQNKKFLLSIFSRYTNWDIMSFFAENGVQIVEEDRTRLILESGDSRELLDCLLSNLKKNNCGLHTNCDVKQIVFNDTPPLSGEGNSKTSLLTQESITSPLAPLPQGTLSGLSSIHLVLRGEGDSKTCKERKIVGEKTPLLLEENGLGDKVFTVILENGKQYQAKNIIIASGGKSFPQIGTTGEAYNIAKSLGLEVVTPYRTLCGMATKKDLSDISGVSTNLTMKLYDRKNPKKAIYTETGPLLFTHFGVSGPIVHNVSNALGEYLNSKSILWEKQNKTSSVTQESKISPLTPLLQGEGNIGNGKNTDNKEQEFEKYILENMYLELTFDIENTPKRIVKFFGLSFPSPTGEGARGEGNITRDKDNIITLDLQNWRSWREAKATGGGVATSELDNHMQAKKVPGLYFIGEAVDVTGKTGGFNLQWAWSSAFVSAEHINKSN